MAIPLKDLLPFSLNKAGISTQVTAAGACSAFEKTALEIFGDKAKDNVHALYLKNKTLTIAAVSPAWGQELKLHEQDILDKLEKIIGRGKVERLRFFV